MKHFTSVHDVANVQALVSEALAIKQSKQRLTDVGLGKAIAMLFLNPSLRTRMSTQRAAQLLGMDAMVLNLQSEGWNLEFRDGIRMDGASPEHIREAAPVLGAYCDVLAIRSFPNLIDRDADYKELVLEQVKQHAGRPVLSLESATRHPLQSLADCVTVVEFQQRTRPKVVLTWAPHIKPLPQAVPNSFVEWMRHMDVDLSIACPPGYELCDTFAADISVIHNQNAALAGADFVYAKNWSSYHDYGKMPGSHDDWLITEQKMALTNNGKLMHCLPVRRDVEVAAEVLDGTSSLVVKQAENRLWAAVTVLKHLIGAV